MAEQLTNESGELSTSTRNDSPSSAPSTLLNFTLVISRPMNEFPETGEVVGVGSCQQRFHFRPSGSIDTKLKVKKQAVKNQCLHNITQKPKYQYYVHRQASAVQWSYAEVSSGIFPPAQTRSAVSLSAIGRTMHRYRGRHYRLHDSYAM